ncbi:MAG: nucleotide pyrophosphohydrolase [Ruminococcaceae bacterium]|nr:nucleotide pyrophosphohydrolase [Oscillospiraceae bacterium]
MNLTINDLQDYLADRYCGWANEQGMFMKLVEEIGEVAEVLNKRAGRKASDENDLQEQLGIELADMIHYIVAIAALNDIPLSKVIVEKDRIASVKYNHTVNLETFVATHSREEQ